MSVFVIKRRDRLPVLVVTLTDDGTPVDLTAATAARLILRGVNGIKVDAAATVLDQGVSANLGKVSYEWDTDDTDTPGDYSGEVEVTWSGGKPQTFPCGEDGDNYFTVRILSDLDD